MPLKPLRYKTVRQVLRWELVRAEDAATADLIRDLKPVAKRRWFTRDEFLRMCTWKSPRAKRYYERTSEATVRRIARRVLRTRSERQRLKLLTSLPGVSVPMASAILTLIDPRRYGVIDIRAWQLLFEFGAVRTNPRGQGFGVDQWLQYLTILRSHARELGVSVRRIEHTLFECHRKHQEGLLYSSRPVAREPAALRHLVPG